MSELIVACVRTGENIPFDCVKVLRNAVSKFMPRQHTMACLTDQPERCSGVAFVDISAMGLTGRMAPMALFEPQWRGRSKVIAIDFGVAVIGDISPLADVPGELAICKGIMVIGGGMGDFVWKAFERRQAGIAQLYPSAPDLHRLLPPDFFSTRLRSM